MNKISVTIISYNEEQNICDFLKSVSWADEIIVVDAHSSNLTVKLCHKYTDKVFSYHWSGYVKQKNVTLSITPCNWILSIDADEKFRCIADLPKEEIYREMVNIFRKQLSGIRLAIT